MDTISPLTVLKVLLIRKSALGQDDDEVFALIEEKEVVRLSKLLITVPIGFCMSKLAVGGNALFADAYFTNCKQALVWRRYRPSRLRAADQRKSISVDQR